MADDLLDIYLTSIANIKETLSIKNAQMEALNEVDAAEYQANLKRALDFITAEIKSNVNFKKELQLFQLLRLISPESHAIHPNRYRNSIVRIGSYICPEPDEIPLLVSELFQRIDSISNPIIKAIYLHHELIRIHPFADGNGRVTRMAKNWMLMYDLYPPIFIKDAETKNIYITTLGNSFRELNAPQNEWSEHTTLFFEQELDRLLVNIKEIYNSVNKAGNIRI
ncbi:MAG: Fic family protein [Deltaproteobacteria bacterium]|nr:Fic family protein [Deltaproteobacteria bacterium]